MKWVILFFIVILGQGLNEFLLNIKDDVWLIAYGIAVGQTASFAMQFCDHLNKTN